jgi:hypothetical protein
MSEIWKALPGWVRHIVVPIIVLIAAWWIITAIFSVVFGVIGFLFGFVFKIAIIVALGAVVVILVKKASR